jgi:hypothetical protein
MDGDAVALASERPAAFGCLVGAVVGIGALALAGVAVILLLLVS